MMRPADISSSALAYLGDCVLELCVRSFLVHSGITRSSELNSHALAFVCAGAQSEAMKKLLPLLDEDEAAVFRRGRNMGHTNTPKKATPGQYRAATGMEALFGGLYLLGKQERINELFNIAYSEQIYQLTERRYTHGNTENQI